MSQFRLGFCVASACTSLQQLLNFWDIDTLWWENSWLGLARIIYSCTRICARRISGVWSVLQLVYLLVTPFKSVSERKGISIQKLHKFRFKKNRGKKKWAEGFVLTDPADVTMSFFSGCQTWGYMFKIFNRLLSKIHASLAVRAYLKCVSDKMHFLWISGKGGTGRNSNKYTISYSLMCFEWHIQSLVQTLMM